MSRNQRVPCRIKNATVLTTTPTMKNIATRLVSSDVLGPSAVPSLYPRPPAVSTVSGAARNVVVTGAF